MLTIPDQNELIPNLSALDRLLHEKTHPDRISAVQRETEQLPYYLRGAFHALSSIEAARVAAVSRIPSFVDLRSGTKYVLPPESVDPISFALDSYLFCVRRALDALITYLGRCPKGQSLPSSIESLVKALRKGNILLDEQITSQTIEFWDSYGRSLRGYRNQTTHKAIILSSCIAFFTENETIAFSANLPDDPHEDKPSAIRYEKDVSLMTFVLDSFESVLTYVNKMVERLIDLEAPDDTAARRYGIVAATNRGGVKLSKQLVGEEVPLPIDMRNALLSVVNSTVKHRAGEA